MIEFLVLMVLAVFLSAFTSLIEAVLYSVPATHVETLVQSGRRSGLILQRLRRDIDRPIAGILSFNTIVNTAGGALGGATTAQIFGAESVLYFSAAYTLSLLILAEVIPKTIGVVHSKAMAPWVSYVLQVIVWMMTPLIWLCRLATRVVPRSGKEHLLTDQELLAMVRMTERSGTLDPDAAQTIRNILTLETRQVKDIMTPRTVCFTAPARLTMQDLRQQAGSWQHSRVPIWDKSEEDIVGLANRRDVLLAIAEDRWSTTLGEIMRPVHFILEIHRLDGLLERFLETRQHLLVVLDEHGSLAGVVTLEDLIEEILGEEIVDEFDRVTDLRQLAHQRRDKTLKP